ncbi:unnamed protein product (macronuclear) [Paramecium tetraurelia]|uniref:Major facilitator superfamily (MFS) profile domain-containing protein n=1 Tax=Paramecium tetraurelia TaxID=5888 RepID=A0BI13_PARTE|nr:uncharacterized protein GSPATT00029216001 [Paramecium tetraurelia]CAK58180.1 unnamed protein product [Paramecium tetraurelia]|eukprot:XP_001425578.1 hypothetical protein (macronuclear) [Paramecium tetraurelia strain d4-2]
MNNLCFDDILSKRIKFGKVQIQTFLIISLLDIIDGSEFMFLQLMNAIIYKEWSLSLGQLIVLTTIFNLGQFIGAMFYGQFSDQTGRKSMIISSLLLFIATFLTAFVQDLPQLLILRFLFGFLFGITSPVSSILMAEVTPLHIRGQFIVTLQMMCIVGRMWVLLLAILFLDSIASGNWRALAITNSVQSIICLIGSIIYLHESPRFLISQGKIKEGVEGINFMGRMNDKDYVDLSDEEVQSLQQWRKIIFEQQYEKKSFKDLFNQENLPITWRAYSLSIIAMLMQSGLYIIIPFLFDEEEKTLLDLFYTVLIEIPAVLLVVCLIDRIGRLPIILIGTVTSAIAIFIIWYWKARFLLLGLVTFKFFNRMIFISFTPLVLESYSTVYRSLGTGTTIAFGSATGFISPAIILHLYEKDNYSPFLVSFFILIIMTIIFATYPRDLTRKPLDIKFEKED